MHVRAYVCKVGEYIIIINEGHSWAEEALPQAGVRRLSNCASIDFGQGPATEAALRLVAKHGEHHQVLELGHRPSAALRVLRVLLGRQSLA